MLAVYGIKNCDTVRKSLKWLDTMGIAYTFHDFRKDGLDACVLERWVDALGWESVLNRRSSTWRKLDDDDKNNINTATAIQLMAAHPTLIKRPVFEGENILIQGFTEEVRVCLS
ncbi:MAG: ArsC family reductase [Magnetovibrio sp.]|nr:ArsC family reductase [Magnetovibrio sp.]